MKIVFASILALLLVTPWGCGPREVDTSKDFAMALNGNEYRVKLSPAIGKASEQEAGFSSQWQFAVLFPVAALNRFQTRGIELTFDPSKIELGEEWRSVAGDDQYHFRVNYYPTMGHRIQEQAMLIYSSGYKQGSLRVRFDQLDPRIGGRVKGKIIYAALYAYYESEETMEIIELPSPRKLELYNFPFDTTFTRTPF